MMKSIRLEDPRNKIRRPDIGIALRKLRLLHGLTQSQVAGALGLSRNSYIAWENNKVNLSIVNCLAFCDLYDMKFSQFLIEYVEPYDPLTGRKSA